MSARKVTSCRVCGSNLTMILDPGIQCLAGQFPKPDEPDPPAYPLRLMQCDGGCGLLQLSHTVDPQEMYQDYWYRSGVSETMKGHLAALAKEADGRIRHKVRSVLDIGCNTGELLQNFPEDVFRMGVDPSTVAAEAFQGDYTFISATYPVEGIQGPFDLIFSIAMFYDVDDPVAFAKALKQNLAPDGLWVCEVADVEAVIHGGCWDSICHEHLAYYEPYTFSGVCDLAGLHILSVERNACNGGSLRFYVGHEQAYHYKEPFMLPRTCITGLVERVQRDRLRLRTRLMKYQDSGLKVHILGASTKLNTLLQTCRIGVDFIAAASDRDPRKVGRVTPGTRIPIISEEQSRHERPDVYLVGPNAFRTELIEREKAFLDRGGIMLFPLPELCEVKRGDSPAS